MNRSDLLWPIVVVVPKGHPPLGRRIELIRSTHEDLLALYRNSAIALHRQQRFGDTGLDLNVLTNGFAATFREVLRRLLAKPATTSSGPDSVSLELVMEAPAIAKVADQQKASPAAKNPRISPKRDRSRGWEI